MTQDQISLLDDGLLAEIRSRFLNVDSDPFSGQRIFFENAGGTLRLKSILPVIEALTSIPDNAGRTNPASKHIDAAIAQGRSDIALLVGARSGHIAAEQSTTGMIFRVLNTIADNADGDNIVTTDLDHASAFDAARIVAERHGMEARYAKLDPVTGTVPVESVLAQVDKATAGLAIIHASNILGSKNDVAQIVREVRKVNPDAFILLDGAQHASHGLIDVEAYGADAWVFVPYKVYSKAGISFAHLSDRLANLPHDNLVGKPKTLWDLGTREAAAYACMSTVVEYFRWLGAKFTDSTDARQQVVAAMHAIERHEGALLQALLHGTGKERGMMQMKGVTIHGDKTDLTNQEAIVAFSVEGAETGDLVRYFEDHGIRLHDRISDYYSAHTLSAMGIKACMRVSLCHYNTLGEVEKFLKVLEQAVR